MLALDQERLGGGPGSPAGKELEPEQTPAVAAEGFSPAPSRKLEHQGWRSASRTRSTAVYTPRHRATRQASVLFLRKEANHQSREIIWLDSIKALAGLELEAETKCGTP